MDDGGPLMCVMMSHRGRSVTWPNYMGEKEGEEGRSLSKGCQTILTHSDEWLCMYSRSFTTYLQTYQLPSTMGLGLGRFRLLGIR